jgi:hypothetical protein
MNTYDAINVLLCGSIVVTLATTIGVVYFLFRK